MEEEKGYLDTLFSKVISRKFLVWLTATILMFITAFTKFTVLKSGDWVIISSIYLGTQAIIDAVLKRQPAGATGVVNLLTNVANNSTSVIANKTKENIKKDKKDEKDTSGDRPTNFGGMQ